MTRSELRTTLAAAILLAASSNLPAQQATPRAPLSPSPTPAALAAAETMTGTVESFRLGTQTLRVVPAGGGPGLTFLYEGRTPFHVDGSVARAAAARSGMQATVTWRTRRDGRRIATRVDLVSVAATPTPPIRLNPTPANPTPSNPTTTNPTPANPTPANPTPDNPTTSNPISSNPTTANPVMNNPTTSNPIASNPTPPGTVEPQPTPPPQPTPEPQPTPRPTATPTATVTPTPPPVARPPAG